MDPLRPVDPDEEVLREAADKRDESDSDAETPAEIQTAGAPERRPTDDRADLADEPVGAESDAMIAPASTQASSTNSAASPDADGITSRDLASNDAELDPPSTTFDFAPAAAENSSALSVGQLPSIEPVDTAPFADVIPSPDINDSDASTERAIDRAIPRDSWPEATGDSYAALQQTPLPVIDPLNTDEPSSSPDTVSFTNRSSLTVDQKPSREGSPDDHGKHDTAPANDDKSDQADPRPESSPVERKRKAALREEIERFIENFYAQMARADALLSPPFDGGPPMARPIVLVSLDEEPMQAITNEALAESGSRFAKTAAELAQEKVDEAFWLRDCEMRALYRGR